jgi:hypothetical protein
LRGKIKKVEKILKTKSKKNVVTKKVVWWLDPFFSGFLCQGSLFRHR